MPCYEVNAKGAQRVRVQVRDLIDDGCLSAAHSDAETIADAFITCANESVDLDEGKPSSVVEVHASRHVELYDDDFSAVSPGVCAYVGGIKATPLSAFINDDVPAWYSVTVLLPAPLWAGFIDRGTFAITALYYHTGRQDWIVEVESTDGNVLVRVDESSLPEIIADMPDPVAREVDKIRTP